jgi:hypothetical protein
MAQTMGEPELVGTEGYARHYIDTPGLMFLCEVSMPEGFEKVTIGDLLDRLVQRCGEREALVFAGQRWSFQQLQADSDRAARGLMQ